MEASRTLSCRYSEVSAALNHQVDELLVSIVTDLRTERNRRCRQTAAAAASDAAALPLDGGTEMDATADTPTTNCVWTATEMLKGLFRKHQRVISRSCENLLD